MTTLIITISALTAIAFIVGYGRHLAAYARTVPVRTRQARSPLDEAHRILAQRYARGSIGLEEYRRMESILRR